MAAKPDLNDAHTPSQTVAMLPGWVTSVRGETIETMAFSSGAALALLDMALRDPTGILPDALLRDRLALKAAIACLKLEGRNEAQSDVRDALCLTRDGDAPGPAGEMFARWRKGAQINLAASGWQARLARILPDRVSQSLADIDLTRSKDTPAAQAAAVLGEILTRFPQQEAAALMLADAVLARAVGWSHLVPLLAAHLPRQKVRSIAAGDGDGLWAVHGAIVSGGDSAIRMAADLSRRASKLWAIAPKLRAKGSDEALALFLSHDAVVPSGMLSPRIKGTSVVMTDRAARRLCDRLVDLGVVRELTGRSTFRLYGL